MASFQLVADEKTVNETVISNKVREKLRSTGVQKDAWIQELQKLIETPNAELDSRQGEPGEPGESGNDPQSFYLNLREQYFQGTGNQRSITEFKEWMFEALKQHTQRAPEAPRGDYRPSAPSASQPHWGTPTIVHHHYSSGMNFTDFLILNALTRPRVVAYVPAPSSGLGNAAKESDKFGELLVAALLLMLLLGALALAVFAAYWALPKMMKIGTNLQKHRKIPQMLFRLLGAGLGVFLGINASTVFAGGLAEFVGYLDTTGWSFMTLPTSVLICMAGGILLTKYLSQGVQLAMTGSTNPTKYQLSPEEIRLARDNKYDAYQLKGFLESLRTLKAIRKANQAPQSELDKLNEQINKVHTVINEKRSTQNTNLNIGHRTFCLEQQEKNYP